MKHKHIVIDAQDAGSFDLARHRAFMKDLAPHLVGGVFSAMFTLYFFYDLSSVVQHATWVVAHAVMGMIFSAIYFLYVKKPGFLSLKQWMVISYGMVTLLSVYWSLPTFLFLDTDNVLYVVILLLQLLTVCVAPAPAIVCYPAAYILFVSLPFSAVFLFLIVNAHHYDFFIYIMPVACWITLVLYGVKLKDNVFKALNLQVENVLAWRSAEQANIAKSTFLAAASHDIRQPLQAVSLLLEAFDETQQREKEQQLLKHLKSSVSSMSELLNSLLEVSRLDAQVINVVPEHIALKPLCEKLLQELEQQRQHKPITFYLNCGNVIAYADPIILKRILRNLLNNALRYTSAGSITLSVEQQEGKITIRVIDTGPGIEESEQQTIFNEFYRSAGQASQGSKGLGLGLSIVRRLCELHGWQIALRSVKNEGSEFSVTVDAGDADQINADITLSAISNLQGISILIVDDEASVLEGLQHLLEKWGAAVVAYGSADEAIDDLQQNRINTPDLMISDYRLGENKTGVEFIRQVHETIDANIETILITGDTAASDIKNTKASGSVVLHKPIKPSQLRKLIQLKLKHLL